MLFKRIEPLLVVFLLIFLDLSIAYAQDAIVYSRCERTTDHYELTGEVTINGQRQTVTRTMTGLDIYDVLPDVANFLSGFSAPCDLVYRDPSGVETVIYDCSSQSTQASSCAALDPAVSFDGKTIAFAVFRGTLKNHSEYVDSRVLHPDADKESLGLRGFPNKLLQTTGAHLHFYNLETNATRTTPFEAGVYDSGPAFISDSRIAFTSSRDGHTTTLVWGTSGSRIGTRIWTVDIDGGNPDLASHHSLSQEQHPFMLKDGRLAYSSWQVFGGLPFRYHNGIPGGFDTIENLFHIYAQDPDGAGNFSIYGQHSGSHGISHFGEDHNAAHFITQTSDDRIWFADYYRGNNSGLGAIIGVMAEDPGKEGTLPADVHDHADFYVPSDVINFASWSLNSDIMAVPILSPQITHPGYSDPIPFAGRLGHPSALPDNGLMLVWGKGACSTVASPYIFEVLNRPVPPVTTGWGSGVAMNIMTSLQMDIPGCDAGIYRATRIPSAHPNDLELIVDSPDWHEIMARAVVPYSAIHGVDHPGIIERADLRTTHASLETGTPFGLLGAASITDRETHPMEGIQFVGERQFNLQGTDTIDYTDDELCGVRILGVMPNRNINTFYDIANYAGERVSILGEIPVLNRKADGSRAIDPSGHPDTSFLVRMPANTPYLMQGVDCDGRTLNTDQTWQSLRPGEEKTCGGCHVHSKETRIQFPQSFAATAGYTIPRLGEGTVPLLTGKSGETVQTRSVPGYGMQIEFTRDIKPIFDQHCIACHSSGSPAGGLALDLTGGENTTKFSTWWCLVADRAQACVADANKTATGVGDGYVFRRPQMTRYIRAFNSRSSLLYWKAANQRTDNRTDGQDPTDIDFGAAHPTTISANELGLLSRWIDIGAPGGSKELLDTQKPTLHVAAGNTSGSISQLRIGTVDLGSGIDPASLWVCVMATDGTCNTNLAGPAQMHGVTVVDLGGSLSDPDAEVYVSVRDMAGNKTEVYRSVNWFLNNGSDNPVPNNDTEAPKVTITQPLGGNVSGTVPVTVNYSDNVGVVSVDFYVNGTLQHTSSQAPFSYSLDTALLTVGNSYTISAVAFDAESNQGVSNTVTVTVSNGSTTEDTQAPVISIVSPVAGNTVSGNVPVSFNYSDDVAVTAVDLFVNGQLHSRNTQAPFTFTVDTGTLADGGYTLTARAFDAAGNEGDSGNVSVTVSNNGTGTDTDTDTQAPVINIVSPQAGVISGYIFAGVSVSDNVGVTSVKYYANGELIVRSTQAPFGIAMNTALLADGDYVLTAHAVDAAGNEGISPSVAVTIKNNTTLSDTESPAISIASPIAGSIVSGSVPVAFSYSDNVAVTAVDLYVNGQLYGRNTQAPFTFTVDTGTLGDGSYTLTARAFDAAGNEGGSGNVSVTVNNSGTGTDTQAPVINIISPQAGVISGYIFAGVDVSDNVGVTSVNYYANGELIVRSTQAPFGIAMNTALLADGDYVLTAHAVDAAGNEGISPSVAVTIKNNTTPADTESPAISIASPIAGSIVSGSVPIALNYSDNVAVTAVDLYIDGQLFGSSSQEPFAFTVDTESLPDGSHTLTAHASDAAGNTGVSGTVTMTVSNTVADTEVPVVSIVTPSAGNTVSGSVPVAFSYSDNVAVTAVDLYVNGQLYGRNTQAPFTFTVDTGTLGDGSYTLTARAFDAAGNEGGSGNVSVTVNNSGTGTDTQAPVINIISPQAGVISGYIFAGVDVSDNVGVTSVNYYANGELIVRSTQAPFGIAMNTALLADGDYVLTAHAVDAAGNEGISPSVAVTIKNNTTPADTESPAISIASPIAGSIVSGSVPIALNYSDNVAVTAVDLYIDGQLFGSSSQEPFAFTVDTESLPDGSHTLTAHASDAAGNTGVSGTVTMTVSNTVADTEVPVVSIVTPSAGNTVSGSVPVAFSYSDNVAVTAVDLYVNGQLYGRNTQAPFTFTVDTGTLGDGSYTLTARAFDAAGNEGGSGNVSVTVNNSGTGTDTQAPVINIISPQAGVISGYIFAGVDVSDNVGVTSVKYYVNGELIVRSTQAPFGIAINTALLADGDYVLTAHASDVAGNEGVSPSVTVTIDNNR